MIIAAMKNHATHAGVQEQACRALCTLAANGKEKGGGKVCIVREGERGGSVVKYGCVYERKGEEESNEGYNRGCTNPNNHKG